MIKEKDGVRFFLESTTNDAPIIYLNGALADDPETPELDKFNWLKLDREYFPPDGRNPYYVQMAYYQFRGVNYFRSNLEGRVGAHYQFMPLISTIPGLVRQSGLTTPERIDFWTEDTENGMLDMEIYNDFVDPDTGDLYGTCTSFISFIAANRLGADGKRYIDFIHRVEFTSAMDGLSFNPMLQGISAMFSQEGVNSLDALKWDDPEGFVHYLDLEEDDWSIAGTRVEKNLLIGSWYEFRSTKNSWFNSKGTQWRVEVLETSRPDLNLSLRVVNTGNLFHGEENFWTELNFENHERILDAGESYSVTLKITTEMTDSPWQSVFTNGFEDASGWLLSGGAWINPTGAVEIVERDKLAEGVAALRLEVSDTNVLSSAELTNSFSCAGASQIKVSFWYETVNLETNDTLTVELYDGTTWTQLQEIHAFLPVTDDIYNDNGWPRFQRIHRAAGNQTFSDQMKVRFSLDAAQVGAAVYIDDVKVLRQEQSPPICNTDFASTGKDPLSPLSITPLENDYDLDADVLSIVAVGSPQVNGGLVQLVDSSTLLYTPPDTGYIGTDQIKYWASDGTTTNAANVKISVGAYNAGSNIYNVSAVDALEGGSLVNGYIKNIHNTGDFFEWTFWVPFAGTYTLDFYAKSGGAYTLEVTVDGVVKDPTLSFGGEGWGTNTKSSLPVVLESGFHTVRITTNGSGNSRIPQHQQMIVNAPPNTFDDWAALTYDPEERLTSSFTFEGLASNGSGLTFSFDAAPTSTYHFVTTESLLPANWTDATNVAPSLEGTLELTVPSTNSSGFYRLYKTPFRW